MYQKYKPSKCFVEDFQDIVVGQARVIYDDDTWYGRPAGWMLPGGSRTQNREVAYAFAVVMNRCMGGVEVTA